MNSLLAADLQLFLIINGSYHSHLLDWLALMLSDAGNYGAIWFACALFLFIGEVRKGLRFFAPLLLAGAGSLVLVDMILKPMVARARPTAEMGAIIVGGGSDNFSFPSGHATIAFAMAVVLASKEPRGKWLFYVLATLIALSRVYIGVHYPLDIIVGCLLGYAIGRISLRISR